MNFRLDLQGFENLLPDDLDNCRPTVNLSNCDFVFPEGALGVFLLLKYWISQGKRPQVFRPESFDTDSYFERTGVPRSTYGFVDYYSSTMDLFHQRWNELGTMQEITPVSNQSDVARIVEKFGGLLRNQYQDTDKTNALQSAMLEVFQNMPDHAGLGKEFIEGYVNIQAYKFEDKARVIVAAGDLGVGIAESLRTSQMYRDLAKNDIIALKLAVEMAASRHKEDALSSRGGGLRRAVENVKAVGGHVVIRSGSAAMIVGPRGHAIENSYLKFFPGTQIVITVSG